MIFYKIPPAVKKYWQNAIIRDTVFMILFGGISILLGLIQFNIPDIEGGSSDLREIPLFISIFYFSNPAFTIGMSAITSILTPANGSYITTFLMHAITLLVSWYFYRFLNKRSFSIYFTGFLWMIFVAFTYLAFFIPVMIITNHIVGLNLETDFHTFYLNIIHKVRFELITTSIISSLYLIQFKYRNSLITHLNNLEDEVAARTEELNSTIEELRTTQQYLIISQKMASLGTLSSGIAHEINNPLNYIKGGNYIISELKQKLVKYAPDNLMKECAEATNIIDTGIEKAVNIVNSLMTFSTKEPSELVTADIHEVINNTILFIHASETKDIIFEKRYGLKSDIPFYPDKMHLILANILSNAVYEVNKLKNEQSRWISVSTEQDENYAIIKISNNGRQIPEADLHKIFDPFYTTKDPGEGVGLGLSIAYSLVSEHGGFLSVENLDKGVCFTIKIPLSPET